PRPVTAAGVTHLDEANAALRQSARQQHLPAEVVGVGLTDAIEIEHMPRLAREIDRLRSGRLHPRGQFVRAGAGGDLRVGGIAVAEFMVQIVERLHLPIALRGRRSAWDIEIRYWLRARLKRRR